MDLKTYFTAKLSLVSAFVKIVLNFRRARHRVDIKTSFYLSGKLLWVSQSNLNWFKLYFSAPQTARNNAKWVRGTSEPSLNYQPIESNSSDQMGGGGGWSVYAPFIFQECVMNGRDWNRSHYFQVTEQRNCVHSNVSQKTLDILICQAHASKMRVAAICCIHSCLKTGASPGKERQTCC